MYLKKYTGLSTVCGGFAAFFAFIGACRGTFGNDIEVFGSQGNQSIFSRLDFSRRLGFNGKRQFQFRGSGAQHCNSQKGKQQKLFYEKIPLLAIIYAFSPITYNTTAEFCNYKSLFLICLRNLKNPHSPIKGRLKNIFLR